MSCGLLAVCKLHSVEWKNDWRIMNWKGFGRKCHGLISILFRHLRGMAE
jgi:hypothetical protein